jgi:hypothetical protein
LKINSTLNFFDGNQSDFIFDDSRIIFNETSATLASSGDISVPYIINAEGIDFSFLTKLTITCSSPSSESQIRIQLSHNSENWYYYDSTNWVETSLTGSDIISGSNLPSQITSSIFDQYVKDVDAGKLFFKIFSGGRKWNLNFL